MMAEMSHGREQSGSPWLNDFPTLFLTLAPDVHVFLQVYGQRQFSQLASTGSHEDEITLIVSGPGWLTIWL